MLEAPAVWKLQWNYRRHVMTAGGASQNAQVRFSTKDSAPRALCCDDCLDTGLDFTVFKHSSEKDGIPFPRTVLF